MVTQLLKSGDLRSILYYNPQRFKEVDPSVPCRADYRLEARG
jgi:hypothetical protein